MLGMTLKTALMGTTLKSALMGTTLKTALMGMTGMSGVMRVNIGMVGMLGTMIGVMLGMMIGVMLGMMIGVMLGMMIGVMLGMMIGVMLGMMIGVMIGVVIGVMIGVINRLGHRMNLRAILTILTRCLAWPHSKSRAGLLVAPESFAPLQIPASNQAADATSLSVES